MKPIKAMCRRCGVWVEHSMSGMVVTEPTWEEKMARKEKWDTTPLTECPECAEYYAQERQYRVDTGRDLLCSCGEHKVSSEPVCKSCAAILTARQLSEISERMRFDQKCPKCGQYWSQFPGRVCPDCEAKAVPAVSAMKDFSVPVSGSDCELID